MTSTDSKLTLKGKAGDNTPVLTEEEIKSIRAEAEKEVAQDLKQQQAEALKRQYKLQIREELIATKAVTEEAGATEQVTINLPQGYPDLRTDGKVYLANMTYFVTPQVKADLIARMAKLVEHYNETRLGQPARFFSKRKARTLKNF